MVRARSRLDSLLAQACVPWMGLRHNVFICSMGMNNNSHLNSFVVYLNDQWHKHPWSTSEHQ